MRERGDVAEGLILPRQWNAALPECNHEHVDETLLFKQCSIAEWPSIVSHLYVQVPQVFESEPTGLDLLRWYVDRAKVEWHLFTPVLDDLDELVEA